MRVCLDAHMIGSRETGNETYIAALAPALARMPGVRCAVAVAPRAALPDQWRATELEVAHLRPASDWFRLAYTLPKLCRSWQADILHVTYNGPFVSACPLVVTVHDVIFRRFPDFFSARDRLLFATLLPLTLRRTAAIITVSASSRQDIVDFYPFTAGKVHVIPEAPSPSFHPVESPQQRRMVCARYGVAPGFILAVGNLQPRKNLGRLVAAFRSLLADGLSGRQLVLVGQDALRSAHFRAEVRDLVEDGKLVLTGYVPESDLPSLYSEAAVFVYPSIYEGFGLPILEAMACGAPVITSDRSSMPEVAGDVAVLVDPTRTDQIAAALLAILSQRTLADELRCRGIARAAQFTWDATARQTVEVYQQVLRAVRDRVSYST